MSDLTVSQPTPKTAAEYKALFEHHLTEIEHLNAMMQQDRSEINCLRAETNALKAEGERLKAESRAVLARLSGGV